MKLSAPSLQHKADIGALLLNVATEEAVRAAHRRLVALEVEESGVLVERMAVPGAELLIAARADAVVPCLVFAAGGAWTELLGDASIVPLPASPERVEEAILGLRAAPMFAGGRGARARRPAAARLAAAAGELLLDRARAARAESGARPRAGCRRRGCGGGALRAVVRAVVVGAGLAGLVAADELVRGGVEVVVLEARSRVGGRVWSRELPNGAVVEMGAEFILPGNTAIRELVDRFGLGLWDKGMRYGQRDPSGGIGTTHEELAAAVGEGGARPRRRRRHERSRVPRLGRHPGRRPRGDPRASRDLERELGGPGGGGRPPGIAHIDDEPAPSIAGGNQRLPLALAGELGDGGAAGLPCGWVHWGTGVRVATGDSETEGDVAVIAVPASVLDRIAFDPALPGAVRGRARPVEYGHAAKLFVPLRASAAPSAVMSVPDRYWAWTATGGKTGAAGGQRLLRIEPALDALELDRGPGRWLDSLERIRDDLELDTGQRLPVHLGRRPVGARGLLDLAPGRGGRRRGAARRPDRLRRRAHRRRLRRTDGGRYPERAARRALTAPAR